MSNNPTHYDVLKIAIGASAADIKRAYYRLAKQHHPDSHTLVAETDTLSGEAIRRINAAYEVLSQADSRRRYDLQLAQVKSFSNRDASHATRPAKNSTLTEEAQAQRQWLKQVYEPLNRSVSQILRSLKPQLNHLAADPFDSDLMTDFEDYLDTCSLRLKQAKALFTRHPNPTSLAGVASRFYYLLNHLEDALDELKYFPLNFDDQHLRTGQELFRLAHHLRTEATAAVHKTMP